MKYYLLVLGCIVLFGCVQKESGTLAEIIVEKSIFEDCHVWVERNVEKTNYIRVGYSGACSKLSVTAYSDALKVIFNEFEINKNNYPNVESIYVNSYRTDGRLNDDLVMAVKQSGNWNLSHEKCTSKNLNSTFKKFNSNDNYLYSIESIISTNFNMITDVWFDGILPYKITSSLRTDKCFPDSFGVATYKVN